MKRGAPEHPKMYALADEMHIPHALAVGYMELLWHFTGQFAPQGDVGRYPDRRIEGACRYSGKTSRLVSAMCAVGWLEVSPDHRLLVHDWHDHADTAVIKRLHRQGLTFLTVTKNMSIQCPDDGKILDGQCPVDGQTMSSLTRAHASASAGASSMPEPFPPLDSIVEKTTNEFREMHPKGSNLNAVCLYFAEKYKTLGEDDQKFMVWMSPLYRSLQKWCAYWALDGNSKYAERLEVWLNNECWKKSPPDSPAKSQASRYDDIPVFDLKAERERDARIKAEREAGMQ